MFLGPWIRAQSKIKQHFERILYLGVPEFIGNRAALFCIFCLFVRAFCVACFLGGALHSPSALFHRGTNFGLKLELWLCAPVNGGINILSVMDMGPLQNTTVAASTMSTRGGLGLIAQLPCGALQTMHALTTYHHCNR